MLAILWTHLSFTLSLIHVVELVNIFYTGQDFTGKVPIFFGKIFEKNKSMLRNWQLMKVLVVLLLIT